MKILFHLGKWYILLKECIVFSTLAGYFLLDSCNVCKLVRAKICCETSAAARSGLGRSGWHKGEGCQRPGTGRYNQQTWLKPWSHLPGQNWLLRKGKIVTCQLTVIQLRDVCSDLIISGRYLFVCAVKLSQCCCSFGFSIQYLFLFHFDVFLWIQVRFHSQWVQLFHFYFLLFEIVCLIFITFTVLIFLFIIVIIIVIIRQYNVEIKKIQDSFAT